MLENSVLPMGRDSSHKMLKVTKALMHHNEKLRMPFRADLHTILMVKNKGNDNNIVVKTIIFLITGKKNISHWPPM